jgi:hypothetical protein
LLRVFRHIIDLIQYDEFEPGLEKVHRFDEMVDLVADNIDSAFIRRIEMNDHTLVGFADCAYLVFID